MSSVEWNDVTEAAARAKDAVRQALEAQWDGVPALRIDSPPGAGKTGVIERLAAQALGLLRERCAIAVQTNEQCFDLARRLTHGFPRLAFTLWIKDDLEVPGDLASCPNLAVARDVDELPDGPCVVLANTAKWAWLRGDVPTFDVLLVDEAFQLADYRFQQIAGLARRHVLVGDPGQIAPVVRAPIERWQCDPAGPQVACPDALVVRHPSVARLQLPVSRRLRPDTVAVVQPAFYPALPFQALAAPGSRALHLATPGTRPIDRALDRVAAGASLVVAELPAGTTPDVDDDLAQTIVDGIVQLLARGARVVDDGGDEALRAAQIGVVCAHVAQVHAVRERLPAALRDVLVETAERFQGLERAVMFVHHPLSGRAMPGDFQLDAGRLCVMATRHRIACVVVTRSGLADQLARQVPQSDRLVSPPRDRVHDGWQAHRAFLHALQQEDRTVALA